MAAENPSLPHRKDGPHLPDAHVIVCEAISSFIGSTCLCRDLTAYFAASLRDGALRAFLDDLDSP